jgi:monoamine oxidase
VSTNTPKAQVFMPDHDVIVIGAGFAGLTAVTALMDAGKDVVLLEAQPRVGGRVDSQALPDGSRVDTGGQFFSRDMTQVVALAERHGASRVFSYASGRESYRPPMPPEQGARIWEGVDHLRDRLLSVDIADPAFARLTVAQWIDQQEDTPEEVRNAYRRLVKGLWCRAPEEITLAYLVSNDSRVTNEYPELEMFLDGTMHALAEKHAASLGNRLRLSSPATGITLKEDHVEVTVEDETLSASQVLLAVPPVMARRIDISPSWSSDLQQALDAWAPGCAIKLQLGYATPFWRDKGLNGSVVWNEPQGIYACDASHDNYFGIVVFFGGPLASEWHKRPQKELADFVASELAKVLGEEAAHPGSVCMKDWVNDPWSGGAYSDVITDLDAQNAEAVLLEGLPRLSFACSELSPSFPGYVEGAIVAGKQAAAVLLQRLKL